jgi:hypothetical protein
LESAHRVVAKVEWHNGELFPRVGFIVTNLTRPAERVMRFYNQWGTAEQWSKEGKNAIKWTRLSSHDFVDNQVRLQLFVLAYNLGNFLRQAVLPQPVCNCQVVSRRYRSSKNDRDSRSSNDSDVGSRTASPAPSSTTMLNGCAGPNASAKPFWGCS